MVSPFRVIEGDLAGGAPGHCAKTTPRGPSLLLEHVAALPQHFIFQQEDGGACPAFLNPQDSLPLATKIERVGPSMKVCPTLPTIRGSLAG